MPEVQRTTWIFACHDHNRVASMSMFGNMAQHYSGENAVATVRGRFSIPDNQTVKFVKPNEWGAPDVTATQASFDVDMAAVNSGISKFLSSYGYDSQSISMALSALRGVPNPNLGILLLCADLPNMYPNMTAAQPAPIPAALSNAKPEYKPLRAVLATAGVFAVTLLMILFFTLFKKSMSAAYFIDLYSLMIPVLMGCGLFILMQKGVAYKIIAPLTLVVSYFFEVIRMQLIMTMTINFGRIFNFSSPEYVNNLINMAIPYGIVIVLGVLFMLAIRDRVGFKSKLAAWISSAGIFIYFMINIVPLFPRMPFKNLIMIIISDLIYVLCLPLAVFLLNEISTVRKNVLRLGTGAIVWISICIAFTSITLIIAIASGTINAVMLILPLLGITGYIMLLCRVRSGFLISFFVATISTFLNIQIYMSQNMLTAALSLFGLLNPMITWLLIRKSWNERMVPGTQHNNLMYR